MAMIETINLTKRYDNLIALDNLNLAIEQGDCFGFLGPNGAGKTTTIKILATLLKPTWGEARINGFSVGPVNARQVRTMIGYVPDYFGSYPDMIVSEYLEFFASAYGIHGSQRDRVIADVLQLTDLTHKAEADTNSLSRGMKQRLSLARVLLHDPQVLLLDEPASGLDPRARIEIRELLKELHRMGKTILISSHILLEMADFCTKIGIIEKGRLVFTGTIAEMLAKAKTETMLVVEVAERPAQAATLIKTLAGIESVELKENRTLNIIVDPQKIHPSLIADTLVRQGYRLMQLYQEQVNLETAFMKLTKGLVQ